MKPEWRKDPNAKDIQPLQLPHFEVAGIQRDHVARAMAMQLITRRVLVASLIILAIPITYFLLNSVDRHRSSFGQFQQAEEPTVRHRIDLRLVDFQQSEAIEGFIFTTKAPANHFFYIAEVRLTNQGQEDFKLTPFAFALESGGGETFSVDSRTRTLSNDLSAQTLSPEETITGRILFSVPRSRDPRMLILRSMSGQVARVRTP